MTEVWPDGQQPSKRARRSAYAVNKFIEEIEREHGRLIYQWHHPHNIEWARAREAARREHPAPRSTWRHR